MTTQIGHSHIRPRRLRSNQTIRSLVQENHLHNTDLIYPLFISDHNTSKTEIKNLPEVFRWPYEEALNEIQDAYRLGIRAVMLFPVVQSHLKDELGSYAYDENGLVQRFIKSAKQKFPDIILFADVALDPYTTHGHDGLVDMSSRGLTAGSNSLDPVVKPRGDNGVKPRGDNEITSQSVTVLNDKTVEVLCKQSLSLAQAGIDFVCPSDMMDGRVGAIRHALDSHGFHHVGIMSYCAKYASAFYGPFREALNNQHLIGLDKKSYQMDPANSTEALREAKLDIDEGADMLMVKPGVLYLDILSKIKTISPVPVVAYHVSGEYAMLKLAGTQGILNEERAVMETLLAFKRAGANLIATYYAKWVCERILSYEFNSIRS